jgi:hypothetical protein
MDECELAIGLLTSIAAPDGTVSVSIWHDLARPYFKVYVCDGANAQKGAIPSTFCGYPVVVEPMPGFRLL